MNGNAYSKSFVFVFFSVHSQVSERPSFSGVEFKFTKKAKEKENMNAAFSLRWTKTI